MYINEIVKLHVQRKQYTEAALSLQMAARKLHWTNARLKGSHQLEWEGKEQLYLKIIGYLDKGKVMSLLLLLLLQFLIAIQLLHF